MKFHWAFRFKHTAAAHTVRASKMKPAKLTALHLLRPPTQTVLPDLQACLHGHQPRSQHKFSAQSVLLICFLFIAVRIDPVAGSLFEREHFKESILARSLSLWLKGSRRGQGVGIWFHVKLVNCIALKCFSRSGTQRGLPSSRLTATTPTRVVEP